MRDLYSFQARYTFEANPNNWNKHKVSYLLLEHLTENYLQQNEFIPHYINRKGGGTKDCMQLRRDFEGPSGKIEVWVGVEVDDAGLVAYMCSKKPLPEKACEIVADSILWSVWESRITKDLKGIKMVGRTA